MPIDRQTQQIADHVLSFALQAQTVGEGLNRIYDLIIAWAEQVSLDTVFAYNETRLDAQRSAETRAAIPARAYLNFWSVADLRSEPVHALHERLMEREYPPDRAPLAAGMVAGLSAADIAAYGQALAGSLSIEQALDVFETQIVRYASLVEPEKVRQHMQPEQPPERWTEADAFRAVFTLLIFSFIEPISAHGLWPSGIAGHAAQGDSHAQDDGHLRSDEPTPIWPRVEKTPPRAYYEIDPPEVVFRRALAPEVLRAYQEAAHALIHYRIARQHGFYQSVGSGTIPESSRPLMEFDSLSLTGDDSHWAQPVPDSRVSLTATSFLLFAGTAAPGFLLDVHLDPLIDRSATGQAIRRMLNAYFDTPDEPGEVSNATLSQMYQEAEKEVKAHWAAVDRLAKRLLEVGELSKAAAYQLIEEALRSRA